MTSNHIGTIIPTMKIDDVELAWMAGFFDGEGSIFVFHLRPRPQNSHGQYQIRVAIANTNEEILQRFLVFGGKVFQTHWLTKTSTGLHRDGYRYDLSTAEGCAFFLKTLLPYLKLKKEIAAKTIELAATISIHHRGTRKRRVITNEILCRRQAICEEIWAMQPNRKKIENKESKTRQPVLLRGEAKPASTL